MNKFYIKNIGFKRITEDNEGHGGILYHIKICKRQGKGTYPTCFQNIFCNYNLEDISSKRILDGLSSTKIKLYNEFEEKLIEERKKKLIDELQIFMITPLSINTKRILAGEEQEIFVNNKLTVQDSPKIKNIFGKNISITNKFKSNLFYCFFLRVLNRVQ
jgi:hypothetical protein